MDVTGGVLGGCSQVSDTLQRFEEGMFSARTSLAHDDKSKGGRQMKLHNVLCTHMHTSQSRMSVTTLYCFWFGEMVAPILFSILKTGILHLADYYK